MGLSITEVSLVISIYLIFSSVSQMPSGLFADRYGYKKALIIGSILSLAGTTFFALAQNIYWFLVGYSLMGFGSAMTQGADHALLYESLNASNKQTSFKKILGKMELNANIFWVITAVLGGYMYSINERFPFYAEIIVLAISVIILFTLKEPPKESKHFPVKEQIKEVIKKSFSTPKFSKIFIFSAIIGSIALTTFQYLQPLYKSLQINEVYFGLIAAAVFIIRGLGSWSAEKVGKIFTIDKYIVLHAAVFGLFLIFLQKTTSLIFIFIIIGVFYYLRGLYTPTVSTFINEKAEANNRATLLSVNNQFLSIVTAISLFFTGYLADNYDLSTAFFGLSIISMVFLILYVLFLRKVETG